MKAAQDELLPHVFYKNSIAAQVAPRHCPILQWSKSPASAVGFIEEFIISFGI